MHFGAFLLCSLRKNIEKSVRFWEATARLGKYLEFQPVKSWHSLYLGTERYMTKPDGATISSVRPIYLVTAEQVLH